MRRIGREPTPIERGYQLMVEAPDFLDELAFNLFCSFMRPRLGESRVAWGALSDEQRDMWRGEIVEAQREALTDPDENPPPSGGGPGGGMPGTTANLRVA